MMNLFKRVIRAGNATEGIAWAILKHTAEHKSILIRDVASDLNLSMEETLAGLALLERRGFVRVSDDKGNLHARIVAITNRGRSELRQAGVAAQRQAQADTRMSA
jgi:DNA-binding MarR family transcriptional regulator